MSSVTQFSCSVVSDSLWPHGLHQARLPCHHQLLELAQNHVHKKKKKKIMSIKSLMPSNHLILCRPLLLLLLIFPRIRVFSNESVLCIKWPKYSSFSFKISPSNEYSRLISFRIDWFLLCFLNLQMSSLMLPEKSHFALYFIITTLWYI